MSTTTNNTTPQTAKKVTIRRKVNTRYTDAAKELKARLAGWFGAGSIYAAVKVDYTHFLEFSKPQIKTRFCWGYDDYGRTIEGAYKLYDSFNENLFKEENLRAFDEEYLPYLRYSESEKQIRIANKYFGLKDYGVEIVYILTAGESPVVGDIQLLSEDASDKLRADIRDCIMCMRAQFEKRIDAYLNRYGLTKVHKWVYWADA